MHNVYKYAQPRQNFYAKCKFLLLCSFWLDQLKSTFKYFGRPKI